MRWRSVVMVFAVLTASAFGCGDSGGDGGSGCEEAEQMWGSDKTQEIGGTCQAGSNSDCSINYDNCLEGTCLWCDSTGEFTCQSDDSGCSATSSTVTTGDACDTCLSSCQGDDACCTGDGCMCQDECS